MLTAIVIQNFKGIGNEPFRLPIKPITLLFGPNSAGKSTILQAIHYAREVLVRRNLDAERAISGGQFVDLGGFRNFVHNRDARRRITLRFEIQLNSGQTLPLFDSLDQGIADEQTKLAIRRFDAPKSAGIEFTVACCERGLYVSEYIAHLDGERIATIGSDVALNEQSDRWVAGGRIDLNVDHPILKCLNPFLLEIENKADLDRHSSEKGQWAKFLMGEGEMEACDQNDALPDVYNKYGLNVYHNGSSGDSSPLGYDVLNSLLSRLIVGPATLLAKELSDFRYLGPLRESPPREYIPPHYPDPSRWITGLAAWDVLHSCDPVFVELVSDWLVDDQRLGTGYAVRQRRYSELGFDSALRKRIMSCEAGQDPERLARDIANLAVRKRVVLTKQDGEGDVLPQDVGMGMSQLLPIVVACLDPGNRLTCIEQPELHLHPRAQCETGDLIITGALSWTRTETDWRFTNARAEQDGATSGDDIMSYKVQLPSPRTIIIETHSEHLILRILRRIRETSEGNPHDGIAVAPGDVSVCYVSQEDGQSVPRTIRIDDQGDFIDKWPRGFFEERAGELFS